MKFGVVIVNYNCARFALDAALSVLGDDPGACVVIVDNASTDDSLSYFQGVKAKNIQHETAPPAVTNASPSFAAIDDATLAIVDENSPAPKRSAITIVAAKNNAGFAAGCNIGMRYLQKIVDPDLFLLLNPDAVIGAGTLRAFAGRLKEKSAGLCGASVLRFEDPGCVQALGGAHLDPFTLLGENIAAGPASYPQPARDAVEASISYPLGAAMAFRKDYLESVGYLDERFFLYYEEADWAQRGRPRFRPVWAPGAIVYHRHGAAAGSRVASGRRAAHRSPLSDYHMARSRMLYALKWRPWLAPVLMGGGVIQSVRRLARGHWRQARAVLSGSFPGAPKRTT